MLALGLLHISLAAKAQLLLLLLLLTNLELQATSQL
jgi:hypothetical protein